MERGTGFVELWNSLAEGFENPDRLLLGERPKPALRRPPVGFGEPIKPLCGSRPGEVNRLAPFHSI